MFSKFAASTLRFYLQRDNIGFLNENYNKSEQKKMVVLKRTGVCVWCGGLRLEKLGLLNLGEYLVLVLRLPEAGKSCTISHGGLVHLW